ncbi:MAG TPA: hypothetical protein VLH35_02360, partial [Candidatus Acidoferrales bacterium]|nr:hypothetical protein [Candidatus Acidoferrales bacterium]
MLKIRNLLRNSKYRDLITQLPKGQFVYPELDLLLTTEPFIQQGTPYEWKPKPTETKLQPKAKESLTLRYLKFLNLFNPIKGISEERKTEKEDETDDILLLEDS